MKKNLLFASVSTLLLLGTPSHAATGAQTTKPVYAWNSDTEHDNSQKKQNYCLIKNMYDNGTVMTVAENSDGVQRLALTFPKGNLKRGQHVDLTLQVDSRDVFPVEAVIASPKILTIAIPEGLFDQMRKGQSMHLRGPNDEVAYGLSGIDGAINALRDCLVTQRHAPDPVTKNTAVVAATSSDIDAPAAASVSSATNANDTFVASTNVPPSVISSLEKPVPDSSVAPPIETQDKEKSRPPVADPALPKPQVAAEASTKPDVTGTSKADQTVEGTSPNPVEKASLPFTLGKIARDAGFEPRNMMPQDIAQNSRNADYAWKSGEIVFAVKQMTISGDNVFAQDNTGYLAKLKSACDGQFVAEASPAILASGGKPSYQLAETACSSKMGDRIVAVLFTALPEGTAAFTAESKADDGASAIKARDALLAAALR